MATGCRECVAPASLAPGGRISTQSSDWGLGCARVERPLSSMMAAGESASIRGIDRTQGSVYNGMVEYSWAAL
jgi:hypothetical protein